MRDKSKKGTLLWVLDKTSTSMGGRLLRRWLNDPLRIAFQNCHLKVLLLVYKMIGMD